MRYILAVIALLGAAWLYNGARPKARTPASAQVAESTPAQAEAPPPAQAPAADTAKQSTATAPTDPLKEIATLNKCYESQKCNFPDIDPKSYEIAVSKRLADSLRTFLNQNRNRTEMHRDLYDLARTYIHNQDGFVQSAAIEIMAALPPDGETLRHLGEGIETTTDPSIVEMAMQEMKRYIGTADEPVVHKSLQSLMTDGSHFSSQTAAEGILPFINERSLLNYTKAASTVATDSATGRLLNSAIQEYERATTGG